MKNIIAAFLILCSTCFAGEATITREFTVKTAKATVGTWIESHRDDIIRAMHATVISREGDSVRVLKNTPKGPCEFTSKERMSGGTTTSYNSKLSQTHRGDIQDQSTTISIKDDGGKTKIVVSMNVKSSQSNPAEIKTSMTKSVRGFITMMERKF